MDFMQLAKERYSVRKYLPNPVEEEKLQKVLEAGRVAPTAKNMQGQRFLVISTSEGMARLGKAATLHSAPMAIVVCADKQQVWIRPQDGHNMVDIDTSIATTHMMLQAWALGLGSCWITWFDPATVRKEFSLPDSIEPVTILILGYADGVAKSSDRHQQQRIPLENMVWREAMPGTGKAW